MQPVPPPSPTLRLLNRRESLRRFIIRVDPHIPSNQITFMVLRPVVEKVEKHSDSGPLVVLDVRFQLLLFGFNEFLLTGLYHGDFVRLEMLEPDASLVDIVVLDGGPHRALGIWRVGTLRLPLFRLRG